MKLVIVILLEISRIQLLPRILVRVLALLGHTVHTVSQSVSPDMPRMIYFMNGENCDVACLAFKNFATMQTCQVFLI